MSGGDPDYQVAGKPATDYLCQWHGHETGHSLCRSVTCEVIGMDCAYTLISKWISGGFWR